ncbi:hypothetical protein [Spiroplasma endosymbiont of Danaus chrysippus]|uniref:hypothetical protein n=1 Tax=Spiroplasma endosymbiont of Danaus chrysippus TaxID=2691041 RepID=UPI0013CCF475|nr:hypothetical protein [Spiroplasma endosymbiont of Danaus chrysippus]CAB1053568.1 hypothetical protein [Spiroplasma endosymbiont of Danaus chrysippus]
MLNENEMKEGNTMEEKEKDEEQEENKEEVKSEENTEKESEEKKESETEESKEPTLEEKYKELEEKYNALYKEKTDKDREIRHSESYKKYDLSQENINLLKRYLGDKEDIEEELSLLNKDFPHLFNKNKDTNISNSLDVKDKFKEEKEDEVDTRKIGMVG